MKNYRNYFGMFLVLVIMSAGCSSSEKSVSEVRYTAPSDKNKGNLSAEEKLQIDRMIAMKMELMKTQTSFVESADGGDPSANAALKDAEQRLAALELEIQAYMTTGERRDYYYYSLQDALEAIKK